MTNKNENTGNVVKNTEFKTKEDWVTGLINKHCVTADVGAVEAVAAVAEVKNDKGKITTKAVVGVRGKKGKDELDVEAIKALAAENFLTVKPYPNTGMYRMNIGNMLRAAARKRHGLYVKGKWANAPEGFTVNEKVSQNRKGEKILPANQKTGDGKAA